MPIFKERIFSPDPGPELWFQTLCTIVLFVIAPIQNAGAKILLGVIS